MDVEEVISSFDNVHVDAETAAVDMSMVQMQDVSDDLADRKEELSNMKPLDVVRLIKMGKKSRKTEYPGEPVSKLIILY